MSKDNNPAARKDDDVSHSAAPFLAPVLAGVLCSAAIVVGVVIIALSTFTGPGMVVAVCAVIAAAATAAALGSWLGTKLASILPSVKTGTIQEGSGTVFVGKARRPQARVKDPVQCIGGAVMDAAATAVLMVVCAPLAIGKMIADLATVGPAGAHPKAMIVHACKTISADRLNAARIKCKTSCGAEISTGEETVLFGGPLGSLPGYASVSETGSSDWAVYIFEWIGGVAALVGAIAGLLIGVTAASVIGVGAALLALVTQMLEVGGGSKKPGLILDDTASTISKVATALEEAAEVSGSPKKKAVVFALALAREFGKDLGHYKFIKRVEEIVNGEPPLPEL